MSIADSKTVGRLISEIKLLKDNHKGGFLLVEGDSDSRFWRARVEAKQCAIINSGGKSNVLGVASILDESEDVQAVLGVVDSDFDFFKRITYSPRLVATDGHDLETVLITSEAFNRVMLEYSDEPRWRRFESIQGQTFYSVLMDIALQFGRLRYLHQREVCEFGFDKFRVHRYVDQDNFSFSLPKLKQDFAEQLDIDVVELERKLERMPSEPVEQLVQGHDVLNLLCIALGKLCKPARGKSIGEDDIARALRLAFHHDDLCQTQLYQTLLAKDKEWGLAMLPVCS